MDEAAITPKVTAPQHGPRPLPLFLEMLRSETAASPERRQAALAGLGVDRRDAVMIGDSAADIGTAKAAGVRSIAVTFGYTTIPPRELGADAVIEHFSELHEALARLG